MTYLTCLFKLCLLPFMIKDVIMLLIKIFILTNRNNFRRRIELNIVKLFSNISEPLKEIHLYGETYLINPKNFDERVRIEKEINHSKCLFQTADAIIFRFYNQFFRLTGVRQAYTINSKSKTGFLDDKKFLILLDEEDLVHFFIFSLLTTKTPSFSNVNFQELGTIPWENLKFFTKDLNTETFENFVKQIHFEKKLDGYFYPYINFQSCYCASYDHFFSDTAVTIFRFNEKELVTFTFSGTFEQIQSVDNSYRLKTATEIFDITTFKVYSTKKFRELTNYPDELYWNNDTPVILRNNNSTIFFWQAASPSPKENAYMQDGYLWDTEKEELIPLHTNPDCSVAKSICFLTFETNLFHITVEENTSEKSFNYYIWYQDSMSSKQAQFIQSTEMPMIIDWYHSNDILQERLLFVKAKSFCKKNEITNLMLIFDSNGNVKLMETNIELHDIILLQSGIIANAPASREKFTYLQRIPTIHYHRFKNNVAPILILKSHRGEMGEYICYFISKIHKINYSLSFLTYRTLFDYSSLFQSNIPIALKVLCAHSDYDNEEYYIDLVRHEMLSEKDAIRKALAEETSTISRQDIETIL